MNELRRILSVATTTLLIPAILLGCSDDASDEPAATADASADTSGSDAGSDATAGTDGSDDDTSDGVEATPSVLDFAFDEPGPYQVGYTAFDHTYTVEGTGEERTITVNVWYPTEDRSGDEVRYIDLFQDLDSYLEASVAEPVNGESYPVLVHTHGHQSFGGGSAFLMRYFASQGWVSIAPDHVGDLLFAFDRADLVAHYLERPQDVSQALDAVAELDDTNPLSRADVSNVVLSGHSRGAYSTWSVAGATYDRERVAAERPEATASELDAFEQGFRDERVQAAIPMAGAYRESWFGETGYQSVTIPLLALSGTADNPDSMQAQYDRVTGADLVWVEFTDGCHETFGVGLPCDLDVELGYRLVSQTAMAFARHYILGDDDADVTSIAVGDATVDPSIATAQVR